jgi:hypothetical protein
MQLSNLINIQFDSGFDNPFDPIEAPLVLPNGTLPGAIVLVPIGSPPEIVTRQYQARGVVGLVMFSTSEGTYLLYNKSTSYAIFDWFTFFAGFTCSINCVSVSRLVNTN